MDNKGRKREIEGTIGRELGEKRLSRQRVEGERTTGNIKLILIMT